jgi:Tol biopolymer transport system component
MKCNHYQTTRMTLVLLLSGPLLFTDLQGARKYSEWSSPANLGCVVNSPFDESFPAVSRKGLSLYFISNRGGQNDIWVSQRASTDAPWGVPVKLGPNVNSPHDDRSPALSRDGHWLFFGSNRPGGHGGSDLWVSWRAHTHDDFGWGPAVNLGSGINTSGNELAPGPFENDDAGIPLLYFISNRAGGPGGLDIYVSQLGANGMYGPGVLVNELSTSSFDYRPIVRYDGLEMVIGSNRPGSIAGSQDVWISTRNTVSEPWREAVNLGSPVNSAFNDNFGYLSADGRALFFNSDRPDAGACGGADLYVTTRSAQNPRGR